MNFKKIADTSFKENVGFTDYASGIWLLDCSNLVINGENDNEVIICWHDVTVNFFKRYFVSIVKFKHWSKFRVNIITGSGVMTILFNKRLTKNLEIGNTPIWVLPNIWRMGQVRDTKFGTNISNKMLLNAEKYQGYSFYCF